MFIRRYDYPRQVPSRKEMSNSAPLDGVEIMRFRFMLVKLLEVLSLIVSLLVIPVVACITYEDLDRNIADRSDAASAQVLEREIHPPEYYIDGYTFTDPAEMIPMADMRMVMLRFDDESTRNELVHVMHVDRFVEATMKLHVEPGVNPHNGKKTKPVVAMTISSPDFDGPYWHTQPSLEADASFYDGAMTIRWSIDKIWEMDNGWSYPGDILFGGF